VSDNPALPAEKPPAGENGAELTGPALARAALEAAQARSRGARRDREGGYDRTPVAGETGERRRRPRGYSNAGPDPRDPQPFGDVLAKLIKSRGWQRSNAEGTVFGAWEKVVGNEVAEHCRPIRLEGTELTVEAESTAWAMQLRLLSARLIAGIAGHVGHNVVTKLHIHGPTAPAWHGGTRRVPGRGPRDTYG
jgi:predicted nucleic acid-binding Zn ribbon protein